jgi:hypothetical protein
MFIHKHALYCCKPGGAIQMALGPAWPGRSLWFAWGTWAQRPGFPRPTLGEYGGTVPPRDCDLNELYRGASCGAPRSFRVPAQLALTLQALMPIMELCGVYQPSTLSRT